MNTSRSTHKTTLLAGIASTGGILFGYNTGVISGALPQISKLWGLGPMADGLVASALLLGAVLGAAVTGKLCDLLGRRDIIMANAGVFAMGAFISGQASSIEWLIFGRIVAGLAIGSLSLATPLYLAEIAPAASRGRIVSFNQLAITVGLLIAFTANSVFTGHPDGWRQMFWVGALVSLLFGTAVLFLPSSPCWMVLQEDEDEARDIALRLGLNDPETVVRECRLELEHDLGDSWLELFKPSVRPAIFLGMALFFFQQFVGINAILYYAPTALRRVGFDQTTAGLPLAMLSIAVVNVIATVATLLLVDKVGRRPLLNIGIMGMVLSLVAMAVDQMNWLPQGFRLLTVIAMPAYIAFFAMSLGTMCWLYIAEIFPLRIRGMAMTFPTVAHWLCNGTVTLLFPKAEDLMGFGTMAWLFAAVGLAAWFYCRRYAPETMGQSFEDIRQGWITRALQAKKSNLLHYLVAGVAATGGLLFGLHFGIVAGAMLMLKTQWDLSPSSQGLVVSSITAGAIIGSLLSGKAADLLGRRYLLMGIAVVFVVGAYGCGLAPSLAWLTAARVLTGVAVGVVALAVPLYISEIAPATIRGRLVSINHLALVSGILLSYLINAFFTGDEQGWRSMFMVCAIPGAVLGVGMLFLPESPRWMVLVGKPGGAMRMLRRLGSTDPESEMRTMQASLRQQRSGSLAELFGPTLRPPLFIGLGLMFFSRCTGVGAVVYYAPTIFRQAGFDTPLAAMFPTVGVGVINVVMTAVSLYFVDRLGRRVLFSTGLVGVIATLGALGAASLDAGSGDGTIRWVIAGCLFVYMACYALSLGAVCGLILSEIYPQKIRGLAMSVVMVVNYFFDLVVAQSFPSIVGTFGLSGAFWLYGLVGIGGLFFWYYYLPETKDRSLEEIERHWEEGRSPRLMR